MVDKGSEKTKDTGIKGLLLELIGYEKGLLITLIDLYRNPLTVIESNNRGENKYVSGNRLLFTSLMIWVLFNSLIIDWDKAISRWIYSRASLLGDKNPDGQIISKISNFGADMMEKYMTPIAVLYVAIATLIVRQLCKEYQFPAKRHLEVMSYSTALYYLVMTVFSIVFAINGLAAEALLITVGIINWTGYKNYLELVRTRNFFEVNGEEIEKKYKIAKALSTVLLVVVSLTIIISYHYVTDKV